MVSFRYVLFWASYSRINHCFTPGEQIVAWNRPATRGRHKKTISWYSYSTSEGGTLCARRRWRSVASDWSIAVASPRGPAVKERECDLTLPEKQGRTKPEKHITSKLTFRISDTSLFLAHRIVALFPGLYLKAQVPVYQHARLFLALHFKSSNVTTTQNLALSADSSRQKTNQTLTLWINSIGRKHHLRFLITQLDPSRTPILQEKISVQSIQPDQKAMLLSLSPEHSTRGGIFS